jgi:hypothetical protein
MQLTTGTITFPEELPYSLEGEQRRILNIPFYAFGSFSCGFLVYQP